jgi:MFS family permease
MSLSASGRHTFRNELWRALPSGVLDSMASTFGMLLAVRVFGLGQLEKSIFLGATSGGLLASLFAVPLLLRLRGRLSGIAAGVQIAGAGCMAIAAMLPTHPWVFIIGLSLGLFCFSMQIPLMTQIYRLNYPAERRGRLYAMAGALRALSAVGFGLFGGWLLGRGLSHYPWLLWSFAAAGLISGLWTRDLPTTPWQADPSDDASLLSSLRWIQLDRDFRTLLISWMIMGIGNLVASSLFVEYLANPSHGINLPEPEVAMLTGVLPVLARSVSSYPWGLIYDRMGLFAVRSVLNLIFALSILIFFLGQSRTAWALGMLLWGLATAGGNVTWGLWVTKLAPQHAVAQYMSVHTFLTGLRGVIAPPLAFAALQVMSFQTLSMICAAGIASASAFITVRARSSELDSREFKHPRERL